MALADIRTEVKNLLETVPGIGKVHDFERSTTDWKKFLEYFKTEDNKINGWTISRSTTGHLEKWPFRPISVLCSKFNPRNIKHMPVVKFFACLDIERKFLFFKAPYRGRGSVYGGEYENSPNHYQGLLWLKGQRGK